MNSDRLCFIYNQSSFLGGLVGQAAIKRFWDVKKIKMVKNKKMKHRELKHLFLREFKRLNEYKYKKLNLTWVMLNQADLLKHSNSSIEKEIDTEFSNLIIPLALAEAFSELITDYVSGQIVFIGQTPAMNIIGDPFETKENSILRDFVESGKKENYTQSIKELTKFLARKLGSRGITVNSGLVSPLKGFNSKKTVAYFSQKALISFKLDKKLVIDSLDLLYDPNNCYMTGQVLDFDGGISAC